MEVGFIIFSLINILDILLIIFFIKLCWLVDTLPGIVASYIKTNTINIYMISKAIFNLLIIKPPSLLLIKKATLKVAFCFY